MRRHRSPAVARRNAGILTRILTLKADHPFWGYRRIWAHLRYGQGLPVNKKRILRVMRQHDLLVKPNLRLKATRTPTRSKPRPTAPNQWWGIDMTKVLVDGGGWMYLVVVLDWYTKTIVGHYAGLQATAQHWLAALERAVLQQCPQGAREYRVSLMSDNGCQPTSVAFMKACSTLGITQAFTSYNNPKGNADTERMMCGRSRKSCCGCGNGPTRLSWSRRWPRGSSGTTTITFIQPRATRRPISGNAITNIAMGLSLPPLEKWGALHNSHTGFYDLGRNRIGPADISVPQSSAPQ